MARQGGKVGGERLGAGIWIVLAILCSFSFLLYRSLPPPVLPVLKATTSLPLAGVYVLLDPGHGGADKGAVRGGCSEAALNYRFANRLSQTLKKYGAQTFFTTRSATLKPGAEKQTLSLPADARHMYNDAPVTVRAGNSPVELWQRAAVSRNLLTQLPDAARQNPCRVFFISLHHDDAGDRRIRGARVLVDVRDNRVSDIARAIAVALGEPGKPLRLRAEQYGVLNPAYNMIREKTLIELATISNPQDRETARNADWQKMCCERIAQAVLACRLGQTPRAPFTIDVQRHTFHGIEGDKLPGMKSPKAVELPH